MKIITLFLLLCATACQGQNTTERAHDSSMEISMFTISDSSDCSATAIAPHALLTATHCELGTSTLIVHAQDESLRILRIIRDGHDHSIFLMDVTFASYVPMNDEEYTYGQTVYIFGNPGKFYNVVRRGYVAGNAIDMKHFKQPQRTYLIDMNIFQGDSGAGIFNEQGELTGVIAAVSIQMGEKEGDVFRIALALPLAFTKEQLYDALTFEPKVEVK